MAVSPWGWNLPITSPTIWAHLTCLRFGLQAELVHHVQDAAVDRLQAVAHVGQRAPDDDRHGVVEIRRAHLLLEPAGLDVAAVDSVDR